MGILPELRVAVIGNERAHQFDEFRQLDVGEAPSVDGGRRIELDAVDALEVDIFEVDHVAVEDGHAALCFVGLEGIDGVDAVTDFGGERGSDGSVDGVGAELSEDGRMIGEDVSINIIHG